MAGRDIALFNDWLISTNEHVLTGPKDILDEVVKQTYFFGDLMKGKGIAQVVKSGSTITDRIQLTDTTQGSYYLPNATFDPAIEDVLSKITCRWRFFHNMWAYTEHEFELNQGGDQYTQFKDIKFVKQQATKVNTFNLVEEALWVTTPTTGDMEASAGTKPYSITAFITSDGAMPSGFSNLEGLSSTTYTRWKNQTSNFTIASPDTTILPAFDDMIHKVNFESPPSMSEYIADTRWNKFKVVCDLASRKKYVALTRDSNDRLIVMNDPGSYSKQDGVMTAGIPIRYVKGIDAIGYTNPTYFFINSDHLFPIFHSKRYFFEKEPMNNANQPYTWVVHSDCWYNLFCSSRQRLGMITGT